MPLFLSAQGIQDFAYFEQETYQLYAEKNWRDLTRLSREALRADFDTYYLRMRLGIALYERKRFQRSVPQFRRALRMNPADPVAREYLYYALLFSGRKQEARLFSPSPAAGSWGPGSLFAESGYKNSSESTPVRELYYWSAGFTHGLGRHLQLSHSYQQLVQAFFFADPLLVETDGVLIPVNERDHRQREYYLNAGWQFSRGWRITGGGRLIWSEGLVRAYREELLMFGLQKDLPGMQLRLSAGWSNFCFSEQRHYSGGIVIYPLSNTRLFYHARLIGNLEKGVTHHLFSQQLSFRLGKRWWLDGNYDFGKINHFVEYDGAIAYNLSDWTTGRYGAGLQYWLFGRHALMLRFQREDKRYFLNDLPYRFDNLILVLEVNFH